MKDKRFNIHMESLRQGKTTYIDEEFPSDFLDVNEEELSFKNDVRIKGETYLAGDELILHLDLKAYGVIPCSMCNTPVDVTVEVKNFYHAEPIDEIKGGIFNYREVVREAILLDTPRFAECQQGNCPKRREMEKYLKKPSPKSNEDEGYQPFADL